jgi:hypothetical protein
LLQKPLEIIFNGLLDGVFVFINVEEERCGGYEDFNVIQNGVNFAICFTSGFILTLGQSNFNFALINRHVVASYFVIFDGWANE